MTVLGCLHRPSCLTSSRWLCQKRTEVEDCIKRGVFSREAGASLMAHYGVTITPESRVYTGARRIERQTRLL